MLAQVGRASAALLPIADCSRQAGRWRQPKTASAAPSNASNAPCSVGTAATAGGTTGAMWFANGQPLFVPGFPTGVVTAGASLVGGLLLMFWAASRILRELLRHPGGKDGEPDRK